MPLFEKCPPATPVWPQPGGFIAVSAGLSQRIPSMLAPCFCLLTSPVTLFPFNPFLCKMTDSSCLTRSWQQLPARPLTSAREFFKRLGFPQHELLCLLIRTYTGIYYYFKMIIIIIAITITSSLLIPFTILLIIISIVTTTIIIITIRDSGRQHFMMDGTQALEPDGSGLGSQFHHLRAV